MSSTDFSELSKDTLIDLLGMFSRNILTADGLWFLGVEKRFGLEAALDIDREVWERVGGTEARRIKRVLQMSEEGIPALLQALKFWTWYGTLKYEIAQTSDTRAVLSVTICPSQEARVRDGKGEFPCRAVEEAYFGEFAKGIDSRLAVRCLRCPPDRRSEGIWCSWEFSLT